MESKAIYRIVIHNVVLVVKPTFCCFCLTSTPNLVYFFDNFQSTCSIYCCFLCDICSMYKRGYIEMDNFLCLYLLWFPFIRYGPAFDRLLKFSDCNFCRCSTDIKNAIVVINKKESKFLYRYDIFTMAIKGLR